MASGVQELSKKRNPTPNPGRSTPISLDLGNKNKMTLGIRREENDLDGNKYMIEGAVSKDGRIDIFNKAAGLEHQIGKHSD